MEKSDELKKRIKEIKEKIARPCTEFETKKFKYDIVDTYLYLHKFGGYPSYCQSGLGLEAIKDYPFVFQISSDNVARYNVVDSGSLMFFYNENENKWVMYYDFY
mgnify:CR=1 FL=1